MCTLCELLDSILIFVRVITLQPTTLNRDKDGKAIIISPGTHLRDWGLDIEHTQRRRRGSKNRGAHRHEIILECDNSK